MFTNYTCASLQPFLYFDRRPVLLGILTDVSGSMKQCIDDPLNQQGGPWSRSIFKTVDSLEHDVQRDMLFSIAYGSRMEPHVLK